MKLTIIGGGNMGGAIAKGLAQNPSVKPSDITVVDINQQILDDIKKNNPDINVSNNYSSIKTADIIIIALKPWLIESLLTGIKYQLNYEKQIVVSIAAGITFEQLSNFLDKDDSTLPALFRIIPNTAISIKQSMTFIASENASEEQEKLFLDLFNGMGVSLLIDEPLMSSATALSSCGIAYAFRYIRASMEAGVEIGFHPNIAKNIVLQTLRGAIDLLESNQSHPEVEIDKVTTPGGITIKGLNELEANGFTNAIIKGIKASKQS